MNRSQRGVNLISLMIGMTIALIGTGAMLGLYQNMIATSLASSNDAKQDGQVASGLMAAQRALQSAGFGIEDAAFGTDLILLANASLSGSSLSGTPQTLTGSASGNALAWAYTTTAGSTETTRCVGLLASGGTLSRLDASAGCSGASQWNSATWTSTALIATGVTATPFSAEYVDCSPYDKRTTASSTDHLQITLSATNSTQGSATQNASVCLLNIQE